WQIKYARQTRTLRPRIFTRPKISGAFYFRQHTPVGKPRACSALGFRKWPVQAARQFALRFELALTRSSSHSVVVSVSWLSAVLIARCARELRGGPPWVRSKCPLNLT